MNGGCFLLRRPWCPYLWESDPFLLCRPPKTSSPLSRHFRIVKREVLFESNPAHGRGRRTNRRARPKVFVWMVFVWMVVAVLLSLSPCIILCHLLALRFWWFALFVTQERHTHTHTLAPADVHIESFSWNELKDEHLFMASRRSQRGRLRRPPFCSAVTGWPLAPRRKLAHPSLRSRGLSATNALGVGGLCTRPLQYSVYNALTFGTSVTYVPSSRSSSIYNTNTQTLEQERESRTHLQHLLHGLSLSRIWCMSQPIKTPVVLAEHFRARGCRSATLG